MSMEKLARTLKPLTNIYVIFLIWSLAILNIYLCARPLFEYARTAGLKTTPVVLDMMMYYTPDEGYQALSVLGDDGRHAYRWTNYADCVFPVLLFLSLSLPNLAMGKESQYIIGPFIYMIIDYMENIAEKYVLEIYPKRNDWVMRLACYFGLIKMIASCGSTLILIINGSRWMLQSETQSKQKAK